MKPVLFISDLHLDASRPAISRLFLDFLAGEARQAAALYILGDLFEAWIGDDDPDPHHAECRNAMHALRDSGVAGYIMHGNRDFLIGETFCRDSGFALLPDPVVIDLLGQPTVLTHGDSMCIDDVDYQAFRRQVRDPQWQAQFLSQPLAARQAFARQARAESQSAQRGKSMEIMDVSAGEVANAFREHNVRLMIHGHTHRPGIHLYSVDGRTCQRIVLGDWYQQGSVLRVTADGLSLQSFS